VRLIQEGLGMLWSFKGNEISIGILREMLCQWDIIGKHGYEDILVSHVALEGGRITQYPWMYLIIILSVLSPMTLSSR
jgi:hypothetical protein